MSLISKGLAETPEGHSEQMGDSTIVQGTDVKQIQAKKEKQGNQNIY